MRLASLVAALWNRRHRPPALPRHPLPDPHLPVHVPHVDVREAGQGHEFRRRRVLLVVAVRLALCHRHGPLPFGESFPGEDEAQRGAKRRAKNATITAT